jgi:hypothetical protein
MKTFLLFSTFLFLLQVTPLALQGQSPYQDENGILREMVLSAEYKTVQLFREGWTESYPVVRLQEDIPLVLEFDDLSKKQAALYYQVIHCNAGWTRSGLSEQEYLEGYSGNQIPGGSPSFNTYTNYMHHRLTIPNENTRLLLSGNYLLVIYRNGDPYDVVFTKRFMVTESSVSIEAKAGYPVQQKYQGCCHEVDFTVRHSGISIDDPYTESTAMICQNGLWDMGIGPLLPYMVNQGELIYDYDEENIFPGSNEFRFFDTKNTRTPTYYVQEIDFIDPWFHFRLKPDKPNPSHVYLSKEDINGRYHIQSEGGQEPGVDADYVIVHFRLDMALPLEGSVYIAGALTNWQFNDLNRMEYNQQEGAYMQSLLLKQGVYNYRYLFLPSLSGAFKVDEIEGSFYETENEYLVLFYNRPPGTRYDRLLGHQIVHSGQ